MEEVLEYDFKLMKTVYQEMSPRSLGEESRTWVEWRSTEMTAVCEVDLLFKSVDDKLKCENSNKSY